MPLTDYINKHRFLVNKAVLLRRRDVFIVKGHYN